MNPAPPLPTDYVSPAATPTWARRVFPGLTFYLRLLKIVLDASRLARRGRYTEEEWIASSIATLRAIESIGAGVAIEGLSNYIGIGGPAVVIGNHMSTLETFLLPSVLRPYGPMTYVVKRELVEMPVFKHVMRSRQPVVVGRANPRDDLRTVLEEGEARLRSGMSVVVFPQTTRSQVWTPSDFNSIGVKLARRAAVPVVPLALRTDAWGIGRIVKDLGRIDPSRPVRIAFGPPLTVTGSGREAQEAVLKFITARMTSWNVPVVAAAGGEAAPTVAAT
jgi:1-acyl-sn-glycerol-3-phosphate acyltransferase